MRIHQSSANLFADLGIDILEGDGVAGDVVRIKLKTSERQRLRIDLPKGSEILGVLADNKSVSPEKAGKGSDDAFDSYFVSVARAGKSDETFSITLQFLWPINPKPTCESLKQPPNNTALKRWLANKK